MNKSISKRGLTCVSVSALIVDAHGTLAQQEFDHLQIFPVGACTVT